MPRSLPARPSLEWLKKNAKDKLKQLRAENASVVLAEAQRLLAREYGFDSWRKLKRYVELRESTVVAAETSQTPSLTRDQVVQGFLKLVGTGQINEVRRILAAADSGQARPRRSHHDLILTKNASRSPASRLTSAAPT